MTAPPFPAMIAYELLRDSTRDHVPGNPEAKGWVTDSNPGGEVLWAVTSRYKSPRERVHVPYGGGGGASIPEPGHWMVTSTADSPSLIYGPTTPSHAALLGDFFQLRRIVHALGAIVFGLIGAAVGWGFAAWNERPTRRAEDGVASPISG